MKTRIIFLKYAITLERQGAVIVYAKNKKQAVERFIEHGYNVTAKDVYLY